jgi:tight adherence protein B
MNNQLLLFVFALIGLPGAALLWALRYERRREAVQARLKGVAVAGLAPRPDEQPESLLSLPQRSVESIGGAFFGLHQRFWARLTPALAATGHRLQLAHLFVASFIAAALVTGFARGVLALRPGVVLLLSAIAAAAAPIVVLRLGQRRYQNRFLDGFPDALDLVGRAVRAGLPVNEALATAANDLTGPVAAELRQSLDQVQIGVEMIQALQQTADRIRVADFRFFVVALALQQKTGGSLAETLANLSGVIRARKALRLKARALSAEAKASAAVLAVLPFVVGGLMCVLNRDLGAVLLADPRGRFMVGVAFMMLLTGLGTMAAIVKRALR